MPASEYAELLQLIRDMEFKLSNTIQTGLQAVNLAISSLSEQHHRSLLDQERRNSAFADRDRVETVAQNCHTNANHLTALQLRVGQLERRADSLDTRIDECIEHSDDRSFSLLSGHTGYLVMLALMLASSLITFLLAHAVH